MKDLRDALKNFLDYQIESVVFAKATRDHDSDHNHISCPVDTDLLQDLLNQYNLHFVEPEDDKEFQDWQEVCFPQC